MRFNLPFKWDINRAPEYAHADIVPECGHLSSILRHKSGMATNNANANIPFSLNIPSWTRNVFRTIIHTARSLTKYYDQIPLFVTLRNFIRRLYEVLAPAATPATFLATTRHLFTPIRHAGRLP